MNCFTGPSSGRPSNPSRSPYPTAPVVAGPPRPATPNHEASRPASARLPGKNPPPRATTVARLFFPPSKSRGIGLGSCSPGLLKKIVYVGGNNPAFKRGSQDLLVLAAVTVPAKQVERLTAHLGKELPAEGLTPFVPEDDPLPADMSCNVEAHWRSTSESALSGGPITPAILPEKSSGERPCRSLPPRLDLRTRTLEILPIGVISTGATGRPHVRRDGAHRANEP